MNAASSHDVFISYGRSDDEPFVKQLHRDLSDRGIRVWWDRQAMESRGRTFLQEIRDAIEGSDRVIAVIGPDAVRSDYVRVEWEHALLFAKGVVPLLRMGEFELVPSDLRVHEQAQAPADLSRFHCPDFRAERPYGQALAELLGILAQPVAPLGPFRNTVPALPAHFLPRAEEIAALGQTVLADIQRPVVVRSARQTTALLGMGGVGKSVLAAAFARSSETRRAFADGIVWLVFGRDAVLLQALKGIGLAFGDRERNYVDLQTALTQVPSLLEKKVCLIVLDDVWRLADAEPFINALGPRCRLLVTTRDEQLLSALGAVECRVDVLSEEAALRLLAEWSDQPVDAVPLQAREVASECGNLPLAVALCGSMLRGKPDRWDNVLHRLRNADLERIQQQFPNYPYPNLLRAIHVSVEALEPDLRARYLDLAVFPEKTVVSEAVLTTYWAPHGFDRFDTQDTVDAFVGRSLARRDQGGGLTLHDLQLDYARKQAGDLRALHQRLLDAYAARCPQGWASGPDDGYFFQRLTYHLAQAGHRDKLRALLLDIDWMQAKLGATDVNGLIADYDFVQDDADLRLVQGAIRIDAHVLAANKKQLRSQVYGRLLPLETDAVRNFRESLVAPGSGAWLCLLTPSLSPPGGPLLRILKAHTDYVMGLAVTASEILSASLDGTIKVWDLGNGTHRRTLEGHAKGVKAVVVRGDGQRAVSASFDETIRGWQVEAGQMLWTVESDARALAMFPDGQRVACALPEGPLSIRDVDTGQLVSMLTGSPTAINNLAITPDGEHVLGSTDGRTLVWDLAGPAAPKSYEPFTGSMALLPATGCVASVSEKTLWIWNLATGETMQQFERERFGFDCIAALPDGHSIIYAVMPDVLEVFDIHKEEVIRKLPNATARIPAIAVVPGGKLAVTGSNLGELRVWDLQSPRPAQAASGHSRWVKAICVTGDGTAISISLDGSLSWDLATGAVVAVAGPEWGLNPFADTHLNDAPGPWHKDKVLLSADEAVSGTADGIEVWNRATRQPRLTLTGHAGPVQVVQATPDARHAVSGSLDHTAIVWDVQDGKALFALRGHTDAINDLALTPDGCHVITASMDHTLRLWNLRTGEFLRTLGGHAGPVTCVAAMPDGVHVVSGSQDQSLRVWDLRAGAAIAAFSGENPMFSCAAAPDNKTLIAGEFSGRVHILRLEGIGTAE